MTAILRRAVVVMTAALLGSVLPAVVATPPASAAAAARPHGGAWHFVAVRGNGSVRNAHATISKHGVYVSKISVRPSARSGCASTAVATISGRFRIRVHGRSGDRWHVGGAESPNAPVEVTIHQRGTARHGDLYIGFTSHTRGVGELELGAIKTCDIFFGLRAP
jgi:hypothetical protein